MPQKKRNQIVTEAKKAKQQEKAFKKLSKRLRPKTVSDTEEETDINELVKPFLQSSTRSIELPEKNNNNSVYGSFEPVTCINLDTNVTNLSPRAFATLTLHESGSNTDVYVFGGEFSDRQNVVMFNELYKWNITNGSWKVFVNRSNQDIPAPRSTHQTVVYNDSLYIFGGEFTTKSQFYHFQDFWRFNLKSCLFSQLHLNIVNNKPAGTVKRAKTASNTFSSQSISVRPSARSGHRMVLWRNRIILFGGFFDNVYGTHYYNDLYIYNFATNEWTCIFPNTMNSFNTKSTVGERNYYCDSETTTMFGNTIIPCGRSGCQFVCNPSGEFIFMYGGFVKIKDSSRIVEGKQLQDAWILNMQPLIAALKDGKTEVNYFNTSEVTVVNPVWEQLSKKGMWPSERSSSTMCFHKKNAILFGGVFDPSLCASTSKNSTERSKNNISNSAETDHTGPIFYNDLYTFSFEKKKWFTLDLMNKPGNHLDDGTDGRMIQENKNRFTTKRTNEISSQVSQSNLDMLSSIKELVFGTETNGFLEDDSMRENKIGKKTLSDRTLQNCADTSPSEHSVQFIKPLPRANAAAFVVGSFLYIYGGLTEIGKTEVILDDCWALNLNTRDRWVCKSEGTFRSQLAEAEKKTNETDDSSLSGTESLKSEDFDSSDFSCTSESDTVSSLSNEDDTESLSLGFIEDEVSERIKQLSLCDISINPFKDESFNDFLRRTKHIWVTTERTKKNEKDKEKYLKQIAICRQFYESRKL